jgi:putative membrane protein
LLPPPTGSTRVTQMNQFLSAEAQRAVQAAVTQAEAATAAEIIVAVRRVSGRYREADYLFGFLVALVALLALLYLPEEFPLWLFVPEVALAFLIGSFAGSRSAWLRRSLTTNDVKRENVRQAALATFAEMPCSRLPGRNGVLVYVALLERQVEVVADCGLRLTALGTAWKEACAALDATVRPRDDVDRFIVAVRNLGTVIGREHPRLADDVNELPDAVDVP